MSDQSSDINHPVNNSRMLVLDTETTGFSWESGHKIVEIGIVEMIAGKQTGNNYHVYLDPEREVDEGAEEVHGLDRENLIVLSEGKKFKDIAIELTNFMKGAHCVAHNAPFDFGHLDAEFRRLGLPEISPQVKVSDSLKLAGNLFPGRRNTLDALAKRLDVDASARDLHGALVDASILSDVYVKLISKQKEMSFSRGDSNSTTFSINNRKKVSFTPVSPELSGKLKVVSLSEEDLAKNDEMASRIQQSSGDDGFTF